MGRIAHVDDHVHEGEWAVMKEVLVRQWGLTEGAALVVAEAAVSAGAAGLDEFRTTRRFFELTEHAERVRFVGALFALAKADGEASYEETEEIREVATSLRLSHQEFIQVKVAVLG